MTPKVLALPSAIPQTSKSVSTIPRRQLTQKEMEERRAKNLCFNCDQRYTIGHKCNRAQMFSLEVIVDESDAEEVEETVHEVEEEEVLNTIPECP